MVGMLTEQKRNKAGKRMRRRKMVCVGERHLLIRYRRTGKNVFPRGLQACQPILYPLGHPQNRQWQLRIFEHFLPLVLKKAERIYFPERSVCVALVAPQLSPKTWQAMVQTFWFAGNCILCTEDSQSEEWSEILMEEYGLTAVATSSLSLLKQADVVLAFCNPNPWLRQCKQDAVVLNLSDTPTGIPYGRIVIDGVEAKTLSDWLEMLPSDVDWTAFCGCFLPELSEQLQLKQPLYAKGINNG